MKPNRFLFTLHLYLFSLVAFAQSDSSTSGGTEFYNNLRAGIGVEKCPYVELGFSRVGIAWKTWPGSFGFYVAGQVNRSNLQINPSYLYGGKLGFETAWMMGMWGAEVKYLTNSTHSQVYFTPKVGLSAVGFMSILYGYNVPKKNKLAEIGRHQFSITVNLSKKLLREFK